MLLDTHQLQSTSLKKYSLKSKNFTKKYRNNKQIKMLKLKKLTQNKFECTIYYLVLSGLKNLKIHNSDTIKFILKKANVNIKVVLDIVYPSLSKQSFIFNSGYCDNVILYFTRFEDMYMTKKKLKSFLKNPTYNFLTVK